MIIKKIYTDPTSNQEFAHIYSDKDVYLMKNNVLYKEINGAADMDLSGYIETSIPIPDKIIDAQTFYQTIVGSNRKITNTVFQNSLTTLKSILRDISSEDAYRISFLCPEWLLNTNYVIGDKVYYNHKLYVAISNSDGLITPNNDSAFEEIKPPQDIIEEWDNIYEKNFQIGDKVKIGSHIYISLINNNTWSPVEFPAAWQLEEGSQV